MIRNYSKLNKDELKEKLTDVQYKVTQENSTERPFKNEFWESTEEGIYVDIVSGEPLFSSKEKFSSTCGWPSFTKPINDENVIDKSDYTGGMIRTEVRSKGGNSHLGHVFNDGPGLEGLRYCINSASLKFIPRSDMEKLGYSEFLPLFVNK